MNIQDPFHDLVPFVQFKNMKNTYGGASILTYKWYQITQRIAYICYSKFMQLSIATKRFVKI